MRLHSLHTHNEHATQILHWVCRSLPCIILWIASAVAPENFPNFPMFGRSTATCMSGHLFPFLSSEPTIVVLNFCSRTRMATSAQPPFHLSAFPSQKGYSQKPAVNTNAQFGLATLWRRAKHKLTPQVVKDILASDRFQNRLEPWTIIQSLGSNTKARFEQTKMLRSNEGGLAVSPYAIRFVDWQTISRSRIVHFPPSH